MDFRRILGEIFRRRISSHFHHISIDRIRQEPFIGRILGILWVRLINRILPILNYIFSFSGRWARFGVILFPLGAPTSISDTPYIRLRSLENK